MSEAARRADELLHSEATDRLLEDVKKLADETAYPSLISLKDAGFVEIKPGVFTLQDEVRVTSERDTGVIRAFETGATRDTSVGKFDFEGFLDPSVLCAFAAYMNSHRHQSDGSLRDSDNWQKGIPLDVYMKSLLRHIVDLWLLHRGREAVRPEDGHVANFHDTLGAVLFNVQGYWHELLKKERNG